MASTSHSRRKFLRGVSATLGLAALGPKVFAAESLAANSETFVPVRTITRGPKFHWMGYYDKREFDPSNRYVVCNEVDFEHRSPTLDDVIKVGMVDTGDNDRWIELGESRAWGWQQGCMLQWRPRSDSEVVWNDRVGDRHVSHVLDVNTRRVRTLPMPIYALSPDGKHAVTADFRRINNMRPGYGYAGLEDPFYDERAPKESGVFRVDLETGDTQLILSLADAAKIPFPGGDIAEMWHYFNHLLVNPNGTRFIVLHRWRTDFDPSVGRSSGRFITRMLTAGLDGSDVRVVDPSGNTSHFIWRDPGHICAWTQPAGKPSGFYLFQDAARPSPVLVGEGVMTVNGHNTYLPLPGYEWILCDTYPNRQRQQTPYLHHVPTGRRFDLGRFYLPPEYRGEWRCDLHPRCSNDGRTAAVDSPHTGAGRQVHLLDISGVVA